MHHPTDRIAHTTAFVTPVVQHWLEREITQWIHPMKYRSDNPSHHERTLLPRSYISLQHCLKSLICLFFEYLPNFKFTNVFYVFFNISLVTIFITKLFQLSESFFFVIICSVLTQLPRLCFTSLTPVVVSPVALFQTHLVITLMSASKRI